jgi:hypothetical protein
MNRDLKRKGFLGIWRFMIPLPQAMIKKDIQAMAKAICRNTVDVTEKDRTLHRFVVKTMTETNQPVSLETIADTLEMDLDQVRDSVDKLEELKVFFYRYNHQGINWAYPVTAEKQVHKMVFSSGEQCHAA